MSTLIKCPQCDWKVETLGMANEEKQVYLDALTGHGVRHREESARSEFRQTDLDAADEVCPFREEPMRAAFIAGWLARTAG